MSATLFTVWILLETVIKGIETSVPDMSVLGNGPLPKQITTGISNEIKWILNLLALKDYLFLLLIISGVCLLGYIVFKCKENKYELNND